MRRTKHDARAAADAPISGVRDLRKKRKPIDWDLACERYRDGWTYTRIAEATGYSPQQIRYGLRERGVETRPRVARSYDVKLLYNVWRETLKRANRRTPAGKPITLQPEWKTFAGFQRFALENGYRPRMALVRLDPERGFHPKNVRFVEKREIGKYTRWARNDAPRKLVTAFGETKGVLEWSRDPRCKVTSSTLCDRLLGGMKPELAIAAPPRPGRDTRPANVLTRHQRKSLKRFHDWELAKKLYEDEGLSIGEVAARLKTSLGVVRDGLKRNGVKLRPPAELTTTPHGRALATLWAMTKAKCHDPADRHYARFGGRGIRVAAVWKHDFRAFHDWMLAQGWKPGLCLVRMDQRRDFSPQNCRLGTVDLVTRRTAAVRKPLPGRILVTAFGETKSVAAWARDPRAAVGEATLVKRLEGGVHPEDAITEPAQRRFGRAPRLYEAFGLRRSLRDWLRDERCRVVHTTLVQRLEKGMPFEEALTTPPWRTAPQEVARAILSQPPADAAPPFEPSRPRGRKRMH